MPPLYSGTADEWCYFSTDTSGSATNVEFIIDKFESQMKKDTVFKSHKFTVNDGLWQVQVQPDCKNRGFKGYVGVFILNGNKEDHTVEYTFEIGDNNYKIEGNQKFGAGLVLGCPNLLSHKACKDVLNKQTDGKLTVKVEMKVLLEEITLIYGKRKNVNLIPESSSVPLKLYETKVFTDFLVLCNGKSIPCHKAFLATRSSVFKTMLESDMKEAKEAIFELKNCTEIVAECFVKYFYTGHVEEECLKENVVSFLDLGEKYDLPGLKAIAEQAMIAMLDKENMLSFFLAGDLYQGGKIREAAQTFLRQNRKSLVEDEGWEEALKGRHRICMVPWSRRGEAHFRRRGTFKE